MTAKLTLSINDEVIESAKQYAKKNETSLSSMVENYLKLVSSNEKI